MNNKLFNIWGGATVEQPIIPEDYKPYDGIYIKGAQHLLKNYIEPYAHSKNCFACALRFLNIISPEIAEVFSKVAEDTEHGIPKNIVEQNLQRMFDDDSIKFQMNSSEAIFQNLPENYNQFLFNSIFKDNAELFRDILQNNDILIEYTRGSNESIGIKFHNIREKRIKEIQNDDTYSDFYLDKLIINDNEIEIEIDDIKNKIQPYFKKNKNIKLILNKYTYSQKELVKTQITNFNNHIKSILDLGCLSLALISREGIGSYYHCILIGRSLNDNIYFLDAQAPYQYIEHSENIILYLLEKGYTSLSLLVSQKKSKCVESNILEIYNENPVFLTTTSSLFK